MPDAILCTTCTDALLKKGVELIEAVRQRVYTGRGSEATWNIVSGHKAGPDRGALISS